MAKEQGTVLIAQNRKARHDYLIEDKYEAGLVLTGTEVKSPKRKRKLLLHAQQIVKLSRQIEAKGYTIVPLSLYFKDGRAKAEIALARGKREFDKRQALREEQDKREALRAMRYKNMRSR